MTKNFIAYLTIVFMAATLAGCAGTLAGYQPQSSEQAAVKDVLTAWQTTWNNQDVEGNLALYDDEASIMYGSERKLASKQEYVEILPERMKAHPTMKLPEPEIDVQGDKATARFGTDSIPFHNELVFKLTKEAGQWLISSWRY
jgi:ketosteroid isomerase-like protein